MVAPIALAAQFIALWIAGRGPSFQPTSGRIVPALYTVMLIVTVVLTVSVPLLAVWVRRLVMKAEAPRRPPRTEFAENVREPAPPSQSGGRWRRRE